MTYPIPPDVRSAEDFGIVRGFNSVDFEDHVVLNTAGTAVPGALELGEPVVYTNVAKTEPTVYKLGTTAGHIVGFANEFRFAGWCWNKFGSDFADYGSPSTLALGKVSIAGKGKHRVRVLISKYIDLTDPDTTARVSNAVFVGADVVVIDMGADNMAKYALLKARNTAGVDSRYKAAGASPTTAEDALNLRIDAAIVGRVISTDGTYCEIEFK